VGRVLLILTHCRRRAIVEKNRRIVTADEGVGRIFGDPRKNGDKTTLDRPFLAWWYPDPMGHGRQAAQAILQDGWKLVHFIKLNETELYRLADDVGERNDLSKTHPEKNREMLATLNEWVEETRQKK
jgi:hypothetical protein